MNDARLEIERGGGYRNLLATPGTVAPDDLDLGATFERAPVAVMLAW